MGIDVAKGKYNCFNLNLEGKIPANISTILNSSEGIDPDTNHSPLHQRNKK
jgi:hypothetical protein